MFKQRLLLDLFSAFIVTTIIFAIIYYVYMFFNCLLYFVILISIFGLITLFHYLFQRKK